MAYNGVRSVRNELVVPAYGELERKVAAKGAVARNADDGANRTEECADKEDGRHLHAQRGVGRAPREHGEDALRDG